MRPVATPVTTERRPDLRFQGVTPEEPHGVGEKSVENIVARIVPAISSHSDKSRWIADFGESINNQQTLFSETSKEMIHAFRNVESFELAMSIVRKILLFSLYEIPNEELLIVIAVPT